MIEILLKYNYSGNITMTLNYFYIHERKWDLFCIDFKEDVLDLRQRFKHLSFLNFSNVSQIALCIRYALYSFMFISITIKRNMLMILLLIVKFRYIK